MQAFLDILTRAVVGLLEYLGLRVNRIYNQFTCLSLVSISMLC